MTFLFSNNQHQLLTQFVSPSLSQSQIQAQIPCSFQKLTCSPSCIRVCTTNIATFQLRRQYVIPTENKYLQWSLLKQRVVLPFLPQKAQKTTGQPPHNLPRSSQPTQTPKLTTGFPEYFKSQTGQKLVPTQPSTPASIGSSSVQETKPWCSDSLLKKGLISFQLQDVSDGLEQESEDQLQCLGKTSQNVQEDDSKYSESDFKSPEKNDLEIYKISSLDQEHLQEHLIRKLRQLREGLLPICVQKSWLEATHILPMCNKRTKSGNPALSKGQEIPVDTSQELLFLDNKTSLLLEAHIRTVGAM
ncbi:spermatogenesis-associated protein 31E1-like, partial [Cavia porcellus]|uniref:spermatogenesis-associated protein 31E1-like n=1 Tax=Cavia porcellus TaxID=10141 RepID=UPI002FE3AAC4